MQLPNNGHDSRLTKFAFDQTAVEEALKNFKTILIVCLYDLSGTLSTMWATCVVHTLQTQINTQVNKQTELGD